MPVIDHKRLFDLLYRHPLFLLIAGGVFVVTGLIAAGTLRRALVPDLGPSPWFDFGMDALTAMLALFFYWLFVRFVERKPFADFARIGAPREWLTGIGIGAGVMTATVGVIALFGGYRITGFHPPYVLIGIGGVSIMAGVVEEILIRGLLFRLVEQWLGSWIALGVSALLFGAAHLVNPNSSLTAGVAIALEAGILLAAIYMLTRRLWAAIGVHMAWNFTQGGIFGVAVSGFQAQGLIQSEMRGPELLTGGAFGAEASLPAIFICTSIGLACLWRARTMGRFITPSWQRFKTGRA